MIETNQSKGLASAVFYKDAKTAFRWLEDAFGFEPVFVLLDADGELAHSQMSFGASTLMIGNEWGEAFRSPQSAGGTNTQSVHVHLADGDDIDAHCAHARKSGAHIIAEPDTQFYGDRTYRAKDPEGHIWTFAVTVKKMSSDEWDKASGLTTKRRLD